MDAVDVAAAYGETAVPFGIAVAVAEAENEIILLLFITITVKFLLTDQSGTEIISY